MLIIPVKFAPITQWVPPKTHSSAVEALFVSECTLSFEPKIHRTSPFQFSLPYYFYIWFLNHLFSVTFQVSLLEKAYNSCIFYLPCFHLLLFLSISATCFPLCTFWLFRSCSLQRPLLPINKNSTFFTTRKVLVCKACPTVICSVLYSPNTCNTGP